jgi:hypothetical protein
VALHVRGAWLSRAGCRRFELSGRKLLDAAVEERGRDLSSRRDLASLRHVVGRLIVDEVSSPGIGLEDQTKVWVGRTDQGCDRRGIARSQPAGIS